MTVEEVRDALIEFVTRDLIGPAHGDVEIVEDEPKVRYSAGLLFPRDTVIDESSAVGGMESSEADNNVGGSDEPVALTTDPEGPAVESEVREGLQSEDAAEGLEIRLDDADDDDTITRANDYRPSAMGLSFLVAADCTSFVVEARAAVYEKVREEHDGSQQRSKWRRRPLEMASTSVQLSREGATTDVCLTQGLHLRVVARAHIAGAKLTTVSLYNNSPKFGDGARTFFQVGFSVESSDGSPIFADYRTSSRAFLDEEDRALAMLYRSRHVFAVGHGCAAEWTDSRGELTTRVETSTLPQVRVPPILPTVGDDRYLSMAILSGQCEDPSRSIPVNLRMLCDEYESWIEDRDRDSGRLDAQFASSARRHLDLCRLAVARMRRGIEYLEADREVLEVFMLTNRVMLRQQYHSRLRRSLDDPWQPLPSASDYTSDRSGNRGFWRTFQLAFFLMNIPSLVADTDTVPLDGKNVRERDLVDLIWFPTGGGKTEAYLALAAFTIFYDRLRDPSRHGCRVLMRYTLRLLTSQQFQRAASLICACELERRASEDKRFGVTPISLGLWVGESLTPNNDKDALRAIAKLVNPNSEHPNPFQLLSCPWCGTRFDDRRALGYRERKNRMVFQCPSRDVGGDERCPFAGASSPLPVCVVDESIYRDPPSMIIGTVDKFAMLAWRDQAGAILKTGGGPDLIIQDELHLISGPLGSMVGLYEGVIEYLAAMEGRRPKIVASTATIRRAAEQCNALYDRPAFSFPPPGLDASDSFFAKEDPASPGRIYMGFLPTAASSPLTAQIRSVVALQQGAPFVLGGEAMDELLDPYWTLIQYFGSLKELGRAATFIHADIPEFLPAMHRRYGIEGSARRYMNETEEMTSRKTADEIPRILKRLERAYRADAKRGEQALDTVLATNMISVGVDVDRLGLMMLVTQPKATSEYIQASSRVGRTSRAPGLVFTLYNASRPRDRSHYEQFRSYHEAFYRHVEPTSVTPFSPPALERALHAILAIAGRHVAGWSEPSEFEPEQASFTAFLEFLRKRVERIDPKHLVEYDQCLERRLGEWRRRTASAWGGFGSSDGAAVLMRVAGSPSSAGDGSWEVPTSMRNVDVECGAEVIQFYPR